MHTHSYTHKPSSTHTLTHTYPLSELETHLRGTFADRLCINYSTLHDQTVLSISVFSLINAQ